MGSTSSCQEASTVAERTQICLSEIRKSHEDESASIIILLGETGAGKSSLLEYLTGTSGHSKEDANSVTKNFQIEKTHINGKDYYIMDTPGFDHGVELKVFNEVVKGIQAVESYARIVGIFLVIPMHHTRVNEMDEKLLRFTLALCGDEYITQVTVVTTFWEALKEQQQLKLNTRLANLLKEVKRLWPVQELISHYQHGRKYEDGQDTGVFLEWNEDRDDIAEYAKDMIHRHYGRINLRDPRIIHELGAELLLNDTAAGQFLGLTPTSTPNSTFNSAPSSSTAPGPGEERAEKPKKGWGGYILDALGTVARNIRIEVSAGPSGGFTNAELEFSSGPRGPPLTDIPVGPRYNGPVDHNSVVDSFKERGWDPSSANRARVGQRLGIVGTPGTAAYNDALRRKLEQLD